MVIRPKLNSLEKIIMVIGWKLNPLGEKKSSHGRRSKSESTKKNCHSHTVMDKSKWTAEKK